MCLRRWWAAQEHPGELYSHRFSSLCRHHTTSTTQSPVVSRNTQLTLQLLDVSKEMTVDFRMKIVKLKISGGKLIIVGGALVPQMSLDPIRLLSVEFGDWINTSDPCGVL